MRSAPAAMRRQPTIPINIIFMRRRHRERAACPAICPSALIWGWTRGATTAFACRVPTLLWSSAFPCLASIVIPNAMRPGPQQFLRAAARRPTGHRLSREPLRPRGVVRPVHAKIDRAENHHRRARMQQHAQARPHQRCGGLAPHPPVLRQRIGSDHGPIRVGATSVGEGPLAEPNKKTPAARHRRCIGSVTIRLSAAHPAQKEQKRNRVDRQIPS